MSRPPSWAPERAAARKAAETARRKAEGMVRQSVWAHPTDWPAIRALETKLRKRKKEAMGKEQIQKWRKQLPADLIFDVFAQDFDIEGVHYRYGAWNQQGNWWLAWNNDEEFQRQIAILEASAEETE